MIYKMLILHDCVSRDDSQSEYDSGEFLENIHPAIVLYQFDDRAHFEP